MLQGPREGDRWVEVHTASCGTIQAQEDGAFSHIFVDSFHVRLVIAELLSRTDMRAW